MKIIYLIGILSPMKGSCFNTSMISARRASILSTFLSCPSKKQNIGIADKLRLLFLSFERNNKTISSVRPKKIARLIGNSVINYLPGHA